MYTAMRKFHKEKDVEPSEFEDSLAQIFLDPKERNNAEYKLETFAAVYRKLTGKISLP